MTRSALVYAAKEQNPNYFTLVRLATKLTRITHKPNTCIGRTINQALERLAAAPGEATEEITCSSSAGSAVAEEASRCRAGVQPHLYITEAERSLLPGVEAQILVKRGKEYERTTTHGQA